MAGLEDIVGKTGNYTVRDKFKRFDNRFIRPYLIRDLKVSDFTGGTLPSFRLNWIEFSRICVSSGRWTKDPGDVLEVNNAGRHWSDAKESFDLGTDFGHGVDERIVPELHICWKVGATLYDQHMVVETDSISSVHDEAIQDGCSMFFPTQFATLLKLCPLTMNPN